LTNKLLNIMTKLRDIHPTTISKEQIFQLKINLI